MDDKVERGKAQTGTDDSDPAAGLEAPHSTARKLILRRCHQPLDLAEQA